jgi:hypothetical protein
LTVTATATASAGGNIAIVAASADATNSYAGVNGTTALSLWGAQLELGSAATTYNSTTVKNLLGFSEAFDNAAWTKARASIVTGAQANPVNGAFNAQKLMEDTSNNSHFAQQAVASIVGGTAVTVSAYVKAAGRNFFAVVTSDQAGTFRTSYFDLANGTLGTVASGHTASITAVGNGWYRCAITQAQSATTGVFTYYPSLAAVNGSAAYQGDGSSGIYIYGAQLSDSASLDPYVPTPAAAPSSTAYYGPRFDYDPVTLAPKGILIEEQRANRALQSEDFTVSPWAATVVGTSTRVNDNSALGFMRGLVTATSANGGIRQTFASLTSGQVYALSFYIQSTTTAVSVFMENGTASFGAPHNVTINPSNGTAGALTGFTSVTITPFSSGYIYTLITAPAGGTLLANFEWRIVANGGSMLYGRPQFEAGAFATSYIPTIASTVTRAADVATINGSLFSQWYGQSEGTFVAAFDMAGGSAALSSNRAALVARESATSNHYIYNGSGQVTGWTVVSGVDQAFLTTGALAADTATNMAYAYKINDFAASRNGGTVATDTSGTLPTPTVFGIGSNSAGSLFLSGHIRSIQFYPVRAADFQLQALTT